MTDALSDFFATPLSGWDVVFAVLIVVVGWVLSIFVKRWTARLLGRLNGLSPEMVALASRITKYAIVLVAIGVALGFLGASIQPLIAVAIIVGVVLVLALRGIANNFAAGVVIQTRHPIKVGDEVEFGDYVGAVHDLNGRSVVIRTLDGRTVHIPNEQVLSQPLVNHSEAGGRRSELELRIAGERMPPADLERTLHAALADVAGLHDRDRVRLLPVTLGSQAATYRVQLWHHPVHGPRVRSAAVTAIDDALTSAGVTHVVTSDLPPAPLTPPTKV